MKKIQRSSELLWLFGTVFVALGVAICSKADLGVSMIAAPAFVVWEALAPHWSFLSVGVSEYLIQGLLLLLLCLMVRRFRLRFLLAFAVAVIYGYTLNLAAFVPQNLDALVCDFSGGVPNGDIFFNFGQYLFLIFKKPCPVFQIHHPDCGIQ